MRILLGMIFGVLIGFVSLQAQAEVYNSNNASSSNSKTGPSVYNNSASSPKSSPISIKSILAGNKKSTVRSKNATTPYNMGDKTTYGGYAPTITPEQARAKQAIERERVKKQLADARKVSEKKALAKNDEAKNLTNKNNVLQSSAQTKGGDGLVSPVYKQIKKPVYVKDDKGLTLPQKVFGSVY